MPKVSIIIPVYNRKELIIQTLESIASQSFSDFECIIVDDGSSDGTIQIVNHYCKQDSRFLMFSRPESYSKGAPSCRNYGLSLAKGEFIQFFDSDDLMFSNLLGSKVSVLASNKELEFVVSKMADLYEDGKVVYHEYLHASDNPFHEMLKSELRFLTPGPLFKKKYLDVFDKGFDERLARHQEWEYYCRLLSLNPKFKAINEFHCLRRHHSDSIKAQSNKAGNLSYRNSKMIAMSCLNENTDGRHIKIIYDIFKPYGITTLKVALYQMNISIIFKSIIWLTKFRISYLTTRED